MVVGGKVGSARRWIQGPISSAADHDDFEVVILKIFFFGSVRRNVFAGLSLFIKISNN